MGGGKKLTEVRNVLLSIKPKYSKKIFSGEKRFEFRKKVWKDYNFLSVMDAQKIYLYATSPIKRIQGYFKYYHIEVKNPGKLWKKYRYLAGITEKDFQTYFKYNNFEYQIRIGFAICILSTVEFKRPLNPRLLSPGFHPPQNFSYLKGILQSKLSQIEKEVSYKNILLANFIKIYSTSYKKHKKEAKNKSWKI